jgi:hypothetical protein
VDTSEKVTYREIPELLKELKAFEKQEVKINTELKDVFSKLGYNY